jgi:cell division septum initiation protein DivIVA
MLFLGKKGSEEEIAKLKQSLQQQKEQIREQQEENAELKTKLAELEQSVQNKKQTIETLKQEKQEEKEKTPAKLPKILEDTGYQTVLGFKRVPPYLDKVLGRHFMITLAEEFNYQEAPDRDVLNEKMEAVAKGEGPGFHNFRDEFRKGCSFRVTYFYGSRDYKMNTPNGKILVKNFMFPSDMKGGVEISSQYRSAMYLAIHEKQMQSAVLPESIFGSPLLSYAFPILDDQGVPIAAVSFSNDISQIVNIAQSLGDIVAGESDEVLHNLANTLKNELNQTQQSSSRVMEEAANSQKKAKAIRQKGKEVIDIAERLKVLALNTAIESTKVGATGKGVGIISQQMRQISELTRKNLKEIFDESKGLLESSQKILDTASDLRNGFRRKAPYCLTHPSKSPLKKMTWLLWCVCPLMKSLKPRKT